MLEGNVPVVAGVTPSRATAPDVDEAIPRSAGALGNRVVVLPWLIRLRRALFSLPLFYKVLVANCIVVLLGVGLGTWFTLTFVATPAGVSWTAVVLMVVVSFAGSLLINAAVLRLALQPLRALERTVDRVVHGDLTVRAQPVLFTDPEVERLGDTVNTMLESLQEHRTQLLKLSEQVLEAQEDERKRISRELHDETAQSLTTLLVRLKVLERTKDPEQQHDQLQELRELTVGTLEAVRSLAVELRPSTLDNLGLAAALEAYTESFAARAMLPVDFGIEGFDESHRIPPQVELVLYRVVQEALTNAARHAKASKVEVRIRRGPHAVEASIADDGQGFMVTDVMRSRERGLGLFGMQERLALVNGQLTIDSAPDQGTWILARVPFDTLPSLKVSR